MNYQWHRELDWLCTKAQSPYNRNVLKLIGIEYLCERVHHGYDTNR